MTSTDQNTGQERAERPDEAELLRRLIDLYRSRTTDQAPEQWAEPVRNYTDPARYSREIEQVFRSVPLSLALSCELAAPGSYRSIEVAGVPLLITRDEDGQVHALVNACRHRGAELLPAGSGRAPRVNCPYHAWSYDLGGRLSAVPGERTFGEVDRKTRSLVSLPCEERAGLVFAGLRPGMRLDLDVWLGPALPALEALHLDRCHHFSTMQLPGPNWKIVMEGYLEVYHIASLHRSTLFRNNLSNLATFDALGPHQRNAFALRGIGEADGQTAPDPGRFFRPLVSLFPCVSILGGKGKERLVSLVLPGREPGKSLTYQSVVLPGPPSDEDEAAAAGRIRDRFHEVVRDEDYTACEGVQRGLHALDGTEFVFGRNEPGVQHFHRTLDGLLHE